MMASANIIAVSHDGVNAFISVQVNEGGKRGNIEYMASVPLADLNALPNNAAKKAALIAAVKAVRDAQLPPTSTDLSAIANGTITI
jgi:hypothetical protein